MVENSIEMVEKGTYNVKCLILTIFRRMPASGVTKRADFHSASLTVLIQYYIVVTRHALRCHAKKKNINNYLWTY